MSFTLTMSGVIVGRSELENRDPGRRIASGVFRPGLGYDLAEPVFSLYESATDDAELMARYRKSRDALRLELTDSSGARVTAREINIRADGGAGAPTLEIETDDPGFWTASSRT
jgi:hypothetical protein